MKPRGPPALCGSSTQGFLPPGLEPRPPPRRTRRLPTYVGPWVGMRAKGARVGPPHPRERAGPSPSPVEALPSPVEVRLAAVEPALPKVERPLTSIEPSGPPVRVAKVVSSVVPGVTMRATVDPPRAALLGLSFGGRESGTDQPERRDQGERKRPSGKGPRREHLHFGFNAESHPDIRVCSARGGPSLLLSGLALRASSGAISCPRLGAVAPGLS